MPPPSLGPRQAEPCGLKPSQNVWCRGLDRDSVEHLRGLQHTPAAFRPVQTPTHRDEYLGTRLTASVHSSQSEVMAVEIDAQLDCEQLGAFARLELPVESLEIRPDHHHVVTRH